MGKEHYPEIFLLNAKLAEVRNVVLHVPHEPRIRASERCHVGGVGLGDAEGRQNLVVHRHHGAFALGLAAGGQRDGIDEIYFVPTLLRTLPWLHFPPCPSA